MKNIYKWGHFYLNYFSDPHAIDYFIIYNYFEIDIQFFVLKSCKYVYKCTIRFEIE